MPFLPLSFINMVCRWYSSGNLENLNRFMHFSEYKWQTIVIRVGLMMCAVSSVANLTNLVHYALLLYVFFHHCRRRNRRRRRRHRHWRLYFKIYADVIRRSGWGETAAHNTHMFRISLAAQCSYERNGTCKQPEAFSSDWIVCKVHGKSQSKIYTHAHPCSGLRVCFFKFLCGRREASTHTHTHVWEPLTLSFYLLLFGIIWRKSINSVQLKSTHK